MKFAHIETLIAVTNAGSIRAAAQELGKTQSALTRQIKQMEEEAGLALFQRSPRGVVPTETGLKILSHARLIQSETRRMEETIDALHGKKTAQIRISAAPLAAIEILPRAIQRFRTGHPQVDITISSDLFGDALASLREGQIDMIIGPHDTSARSGDLHVEEMFTTKIVVITSESAPHAHATSLADLTDCYWAMIGDTVGTPRKRFQEQFTRHGLEPPRIRLASESRFGLLSLVRELDAVCTLPERLLEHLGHDARVARIPIKEPLNPLTISLITRSGKSLTPTGSDFADCIRHRVGVLRRAWG